MSFPKKHANNFLLVIVIFFSFAVNASPVNTQTHNALTFQTIDEVDTIGSLPRDMTATKLELTEGPIWARVDDTTNTVFKIVTGGPVARDEGTKNIGTEGPVWAQRFDERSLVARQFSSPDSLYGQIFNLQKAGENEGPYCAITSNLNTCYFASRVSVTAQQNTAELWAYDHNCVQIGYQASVSVPITLKDALSAKKFGFDSELKDVIIVQFSQNYAPASIAYAGQTYGWGATTSFCNNAGPSDLTPGFRLACYISFTC